MSKWGDKKISEGGGSTKDDAVEARLQVYRRQSCIRDL